MISGHGHAMVDGRIVLIAAGQARRCRTHVLVDHAPVPLMMRRQRQRQRSGRQSVALLDRRAAPAPAAHRSHVVDDPADEQHRSNATYRQADHGRRGHTAGAVPGF